MTHLTDQTTEGELCQSYKMFYAHMSNPVADSNIDIGKKIN